MNTRQALEQIWQTYSGQAAWQMVTDLSRFHRIQASPGYRLAAEWVHDCLVQAGVEAKILSYPADEETQYWGARSFQEWDCAGATLRLVAPEEEATTLADFRACPISLIQRSQAFEGEAEVILLEDGEQEDDYDGLDLTGKVVLTRGALRRVWELAVKQRGALGILFDGMRAVDPVRPEGDLADARQYTSFWWQPWDRKCFGFVLTPRQGQALRRMLKKAAEPVRVQASVTSRHYDGSMEVVQADIPGSEDGVILVVAHLCHPRPSANDNASGAAAAVEAARALQTLIASGDLPRPKRTIRFLWVPEINGTYAYLAGHEQGLEEFIAGINLDMVGEDQGQTGSSWLIERPPDAAASFAPDLLVRLRQDLLALKGVPDVAPSHTGIGAYPLYRQAEVPFSGGSDHFLLSDPSVGVPTPMLIQWPDRFYHTSADTPDHTDPNSLARAGSLAAIYAYWLAVAGPQETAWLGYEMEARFKTRAIETAQATVAETLTMSDGESLAQALADLDRRLAYLLDRHSAALRTLKRIGPVDCPLAELRAEAGQTVNHELAWAKGFVDLRAATLGLQELPDLPRDHSAEERQAAGLIPARQMRGPIPLEEHLHRLTAEEREAWRQLLKERKGWIHHTLTNLALFWADGVRSVLEIADLVELESGQRDAELLLAYFRLLEKLGLVKF